MPILSDDPVLFSEHEPAQQGASPSRDPDVRHHHLQTPLPDSAGE